MDYSLRSASSPTWLPLYSPAINRNNFFSLDYDLLKRRIVAVAIVVFPCLTVCFATLLLEASRVVKLSRSIRLAVFITTVVIFLANFPILIMDKRRTKKIVGENAIEEYRRAEHPDSRATDWILNHSEVAMKLSQEDAAVLNKTSTENQSLLFRLYMSLLLEANHSMLNDDISHLPKRMEKDLRIMTALIQRGADIKEVVRNDDPLLGTSVRSTIAEEIVTKPRLLRIFLERGLLQAASFSEEEKKRLWNCLQPDPTLKFWKNLQAAPTNDLEEHMWVRLNNKDKEIESCRNLLRQYHFQPST